MLKICIEVVIGTVLTFLICLIILSFLFLLFYSYRKIFANNNTHSAHSYIDNESDLSKSIIKIVLKALKFISIIFGFTLLLFTIMLLVFLFLQYQCFSN